jgi:putative hydrolase of the HAD superfamily
MTAIGRQPDRSPVESVPMAAIDTVLWDFGGVFTPSPFAAIEAAGDALGIPAATAVSYVFGPYGADTDHPWHRLERGEISLEDARTEIMAAAAADDIELDPWDILLHMGDTDGPLVNESVLAAAHSVRAGGRRSGLVTNNIVELRDGWRSLVPVDELFDIVIDSSEEGVRKPDPRIFQIALERLAGSAPERTVFLDDYQGNVHAARALGLHAIRVDPDPSAALVELDRLLVD